MSKRKVPEIKLIGWVKGTWNQFLSSDYVDDGTLPLALNSNFYLELLQIKKQERKNKNDLSVLRRAGFEKFDKVEIIIRKVVQ